MKVFFSAFPLSASVFPDHINGRPCDYPPDECEADLIFPYGDARRELWGKLVGVKKAEDSNRNLPISLWGKGLWALPQASKRST